MVVTIITGASSGIGKAITEYILSSSSSTKVFITARSEAPLKEFVDKYGSDRVGYYAGDISEESTASAVIDKTVEKYGSINSVVANAGMLDPVAGVEDTEVKKWKKLFDVNFFSVVDLVTKAIPHLKKTHGSFVLVSSGASTKAYNGWAAYGSSKAALNHWALSVASEVPEVRIVSVAPGVVDTNMQRDIRHVFGANMTAEALKRFIDLKLNGHLLKPEYVGKIYGNLAIKGVSDELNGKYMRYNDELLKDYGA